MNKSLIRRTQFPVTSNVIYLNHAAVGPLSKKASDAMERHARNQRDFGALEWREWYAEHTRLRNAAARLTGATPGEISILKNTSEGLSFVAEGLRWYAGDNVITTDMEFPSNFTPWIHLQRRGVECRMVRNRNGAFTAADIEPLIDRRTRLVAVSSVSFHNGFAADLDAIGELCSSKKVLLCVDAIQSLGAIGIDVKRSKISFLASDGHKWLLGPEGTAIFYCAEDVRDQLEVLEVGWMNFDLKGDWIGQRPELRNDGRRFEAGSLNTNGIYGLRASIDLLLEVGMDEVEKEVIRMAEYLRRRLDGIGWPVTAGGTQRSGIVSVTPPRVDQERLRCLLNETKASSGSSGSTLMQLHRLLEKSRVVCSPREGMLRFAPHFYNDETEIDLTIDVLKSI